MENNIIYLNGSFIPLSEARISVLDRGFIFGDGVYDVIPVYGRQLFRGRHHLDRLERSLSLVGIPNPLPRQRWLEIIHQLVDRFHDDDQIVYLQVTRGVAPRKHAFPSQAAPTVFIMANPFPGVPSGLRVDGVHCVAVDDRRWLNCHIKSISLLGNVLATQEAVSHGAQEAIQFRDGLLTEGASSNVWVVKDGTVFGPENNNLVLEGIRYGLLEELCAGEKIPFALRDIRREEVFQADEVLLSSAGKEILPVTRIDDSLIGAGRPGPIYTRLYAAYQKATASRDDDV